MLVNLSDQSVWGWVVYSLFITLQAPQVGPEMRSHQRRTELPKLVSALVLSASERWPSVVFSLGIVA